MNTLNVYGKPDSLALRSQTLRAIRDFFYLRGFIEVTTPVRIAAPALEDHIDAEPSGEAFLRTSPELQMKQLVQGGNERIFQIAPCFRQGEVGRRHRPEFTLLEWYAAHADYRAILAETHDLVCFVAQRVCGTTRIEFQGTTFQLAAPWHVETVRDAFLNYAGCSMEHGLEMGQFEELLVDRIEPKLATGGRPAVLIDYPIELGALARAKHSDKTVAERWELYIGGMELANAYSELIDPDEQERRFAECAKRRQRSGRIVYPIDQSFLQSLSAGMPETAGCALGVERLLMLLSDTDDIAKVG